MREGTDVAFGGFGCQPGTSRLLAALNADVAARKARLVIDSVVTARGEPILNPVTGKEHRIRFDLPEGFEYSIAEVGRGWADVSGPMQFKLADSHAHFVNMHISGTGVIRS